MTKKKIIWTINSIFPEAAGELGIQIGEKGHWLYTLFNSIKAELKDSCCFYIIHMSLAIKEVTIIEREGVSYYLLPMRKYAWVTKYTKELNLLKTAVQRIDPDMIHVHGTEDVYGLICKDVSCPVIISLQGLRQEIKKYYFSDISKARYFKMMIKNHNLNLLKNLLIWNIKTRQEKEIIESNSLFIGRTHFDKACLLAMNPKAEYLMGDDHRIIRKEFYNAEWKLKNTSAHSLHATLSASTFKGIFALIDALEIVKNSIPDIKLNLAGSMSGWIGKELNQTIKKKGLTGHINLLGRCNPEQLIKSMLQSRIFIHPSFIDNSPNSVQEAQILGMPVIASFTGGIPSLIKDHETGMMFPRGDSKYLAQQIIDLILDEKLAERLGKEARKLGESRNNPTHLSNRYCTLYNKLLVRSN